jgi:hypothetical protein
MMVRGQNMFAAQGSARAGLVPETILAKFEDVRRLDRLDKPTAQQLRPVHIGVNIDPANRYR